MKKLLALVLVMVLALASLTSCDPKEKVVGGFNKVKETVGGWFGIEFEDEKKDDQTPDTPANPDTPVKENYAKMAINFVNTLYGEVDAKTPTNYDLVSKYTVPGTDVALTIVWTVNVDTITIADSATEGNVTVTLPEAPATDINYTITATVTDANGNTETKSFDRVVPSANNFMTVEEYYAAEKDEAVIIKGIVTGIISKANGWNYNQLHIQDETNKGGYYIYDITSAPMNDIKVGMTVKVSGTKNISWGVDRVEKSTVEILDTTIKTVTPVDYTDIYLNAESLTDANLNKYDGLLVTLKGVEITGQGGSGYYKFLLGNKESYVRVSSSTMCLTKAEVETFKTNHTNNKGKLADVVGVVTSYDNAFYLVPVSVDAYSNFRDASRTPEDKANYELGNLNVPTSVKKDETVELTVAGSVYTDVVISWASNNAAAVVSEDGKTVTFTLGDEAVTVTLTATAKIGDVTVTKDFTVNVAAKPNYVVTTVTNPVVGTAYKFYLYHTNLKKDMYFTGKMDGYYYATTGDISQAIDVYLEATEGGYYLCGTTEKGKMYFNIVSAYDSAKAKIFNNVTIDFDPISVYTFDKELNTLITTTTCLDGEGKEVTETFLFGTGSSKTFETISANATKYASTTCIAYLVAVTNIDDLSDADKVAMEKEKLDVDTKVSEDTEIALPNATLEGVAVEWTADGAEIKDGKLVITLGSEAKTVTLTATIKAGEATDTKVFTIEVPAKPSKVLTPVTTVEENVAYKIVGKNNAGFIYFDGTIKSGRINGTNDVTASVDVYVKFVDDAKTKFLLYFKEADGTVKYISAYSKSDSKTSSFTIVGEADLGDAVWYFGEQNSITTSIYNNRFIGSDTNNSYTNFSTYSTSNNGLTTYFAAYFATFVDADEIPEVTDEDMVKAELGNVKFDVTEVSNNTTVTLPVPQQYADKVTFNWISDNACAVVADGKLVITLPADDVTVTLTLEVVCGTVKETKTFEIKVTIPTLIITDVTTPVADKAYKLYFFQGGLNKGFFMDGGVGSKDFYLSGTTDLTKSVDAYLVAVEGGYNLKIVTAAGETKYINIVKSGSYTNSLIQDAPTTVYTFNADLHTLVATLDNGDWIIATDKTYDTVSAKKTTYTGLYIVRLVEYTCKHEYSTDCDTVCDVCAATRETTVEHTFADDCDEVCDCGATRTAPHKYTSDCDTTCDVCGATRKATADHTTAIACVTVCDLCGETVVPTAEHVDAAEDGICDVCNGSMAEVEKALIEAAKAEAKLAETYEKSVQFTLTEKVGRVTIAWVSSSDAIVINGNVVTIKLGAEAKEAVVTATYKCGATEETVEYKLALAKAPTLDHMEVIAPEANKAYKLYFFQASEQYNKGYYLDGGLNGSSDVQHTAVTTPNTAATIYLVPVTNDDGTVKEGCFYIKVVTATAEKYFNIITEPNYTTYSVDDYLYIEDEPKTQYVYDATLGTLVTVADTTGGIEYVIGATKSNNFVGSQDKADVNTVFVVKLVEAYCTHEFSADCDDTCNACSETRDVTGVEHTAYDNACDTTCACGLVREVEDHVDKDTNDLCDICSTDMKVLYLERVEAAKTENAVAEKMNAATSLTVKTVTGAYDSVTITWTSDVATITTVDGVTTITMPNVSGDIVITAVYTCGTYSETVNYKVALLKVGTVVSVDYLVGKSFYIYSPVNDIYMTGVIGTKTTTFGYAEGIDGATAFYIENVKDAEGEYYFYFYGADGTKNYIVMTGTTATKFGVVTNPADGLYPTWSFDAEKGTLYNPGVYAKGASYSCYLACYKNESSYSGLTIDFRGTKKGNTSKTASFASLIVVNCEHAYAADCSTACGICGEARETTVAHTYDNCDDTACNVCGATREAVAHVYDNCEDTTCANCTVTREALAHVFDGCEDTTCANCTVTREAAAHVYDNCEDTTCANCTVTREALAHVYDNCDDTTCANCTVTREKVEHAYSSVCDATCNNCGEERTAEVCVDTDGDKKCDNEGCGKELGSDGPMTDVPVTEE